MKRNSLVTILVIIAVILFAYFLINKPQQETSEEIAKCIGEDSAIYIQLGCRACEIQKEIFGENYKYLNKIDCFYERDKCIDKNIEATPTWIINGQKYEGVQSIEKLKKLTGC